MREGIVVAGSILVDKINEIGSYPKAGELTKILSTSLATGGCVPNVAIDLKRIKASLPVYAMGRVGEDDLGRFALDTLAREGIDTSLVRTVDIPTSFTDVMSTTHGERTFFTFPGASSEFGLSDFDFGSFPASYLHLGYFLLLDRIDKGDGIEVLKLAKENRIKTSIDLVSENSDRYKLVLPVLKYTDNLIINEVEAGRLTDIEPTMENLDKIAEALRAMGVSERVIIHSPKVSVCYSADGFTYLPSYDIDRSFIKGTTGAGDAFCSGALLGIYEGLSDIEILKLATMAATSALTGVDAVSGVVSENELEKLCKDLVRREICL